MRNLHDTLIDWLHRLADKSPELLRNEFNDQNKRTLNRFVQECLPSLSVPMDLSAEEFVSWIYDLHDSERDWSRSLGVALLAAEDAIDKDIAIQQLKQFAAGCPWIPLKEIADGEAQRRLDCR